MTELEYIRAIEREWPEKGHPPTAELMSLVDLAVHQCPQCAKLWCMKGDLYQLHSCAPERAFDPHIPMSCYEIAVSLDETCADAYNEIGYLCDVYFNDYVRAVTAFKKAINLGLDHTPYLGLARVLAETGRCAEALALLSECPFSDHRDVANLRVEILDGIWT